MRRRTLFALLFLLVIQAMPLCAQQLSKFSIASFELDPLDLSARNDQYKRTDDNGALYSIIKVKSDLPDDDLQAFHFNFGLMNSFVEFHQDLNELWVYVQKNAKTVTITREGYQTVSKWDLKTTIEAGRTYKMQLSVTIPKVLMQMVMFRVKPTSARAVVFVKNERQGAQEELFGFVDETGGIAKSLPFGSYTYRVDAENHYRSEGRFILNNQKENHVEEVSLRTNFATITLQVDSDADIYVNGELRGRRTWTGNLQSGNYQVECRQNNHQTSTQAITVEAGNNQTFSLTPPTPLTGILAITSRPLGADITIDGKNYGQTPRNVDGLMIGSHSISLKLADYNPTSQTFEIRENETTELAVELHKTQVTKPAKTEESKAEKIKVEKPKHEKGALSATESVTFLKPTCGYVQAAFQAGTLMGFGANAGAYIYNVNVEAYATMGLSKETVYLNYTDGSDSKTEDLKATLVSGKVGYGFAIGNRLRITPQVGLGALAVKSDGITANALCTTIGCRVDYALTSFLGINLTPEGQFAVSKKDVFTQLSDLSSKVKGWGTGAGVRLGIYFFF